MIIPHVSSPYPRRLALLLLIWLVAVFLTPTTVLWRDSGEFILSAFFLDIVHPPGYPLYAQLANIFALLPIGPVAWRVHLFSGFIGSLLLFGTTLTTFRLLTIVRLKTGRTFLALIPAALLLMSPAFMRGLLTAEAYTLHGLLMVALLNLFISYTQTHDLRYLIVSGFVGGLSLGNHVSGVLTFIPVTFFVLLDIRRTWRAFLPAFLAALLGLSIYSYLPVRSVTHPPLNTGAPHTLDRFVAQISNARDRLLRPSFTLPPGANSSVQPNLERLVSVVRHDLGTLTGELSPIILCAALVGALILLGHQPLLTGALLATVGGNLLFFSGWDPDPWIISLALIGSLSTVTFAWILNRPQRPTLRALSVAVLLSGVLLTTATPTAITKSTIITSSFAPRDTARALVDPLPLGAPFITEASWFLAQYLRSIEGYRADVTPLYQPSILSPHLFAPLRIAVGEERIEASSATQGESILERYIDRVSQHGPVFFEPNIELNARFRAIAHLVPDGSAQLKRGEGATFERGYLDLTATTLTNLRDTAIADPWFLGADTQQYLETVLTYKADLLRVTGHPADALHLIEQVCPPNKPPCSPIVEANRALYLVDIGRIRESAELLLATSLRVPRATPRLLRNLQLALSRLSPEEIEELQRYPAYKAIIEQTGY